MNGALNILSQSIAQKVALLTLFSIRHIVALGLLSYEFLFPKKEWGSRYPQPINSKEVALLILFSIRHIVGLYLLEVLK